MNTDTTKQKSKMPDLDDRVYQMKSLNRMADIERAHCDADDILCEILTECGYGDVVKEFEKLNKWYA